MDRIPSDCAAVVRMLNHMHIDRNVRKVTAFNDPKRTLVLTRRNRPARRSTRTDYNLTIGVPNFDNRARIKVLQRAGEPFPVVRLRLDYFPKRCRK